MPFTYALDEKNGLDLVTGRYLTLTVRRLGAEVIGLTRRQTPYGEVGLIWRNAELADPPKFWKSHATNLFPIIGRTHNLTSKTTDGIVVRFNKLHGFIRHSLLDRVEAESAGDHFHLHYRLQGNAETLALYPWRFTLDIRYSLNDDRLEQRMTVLNNDDQPMPYQIGWHPGFNTPQVKGKKANCHLRLPPGPLTLCLNNAECYLTGEKETVQSRGDFPFTEKKLDGTYMFDLSDLAPDRRVVELLDPDESIGVRVHFPSYPHLGVWSDENAPFICIEPWQGMDDSVVQEPFDKKFGIDILPPGKSRTFLAWIEVVVAGG